MADASIETFQVPEVLSLRTQLAHARAREAHAELILAQQTFGVAQEKMRQAEARVLEADQVIKEIITEGGAYEIVGPLNGDDGTIQRRKKSPLEEQSQAS